MTSGSNGATESTRWRAMAVPVPFVLHGAPGLPEDMVRRAMALGACKFNVNTEGREAYIRALRCRMQGRPLQTRSTSRARPRVRCRSSSPISCGSSPVAPGQADRPQCPSWQEQRRATAVRRRSSVGRDEVCYGACSEGHERALRRLRQHRPVTPSAAGGVTGDMWPGTSC
jgi:hypothetical protein